MNTVTIEINYNSSILVQCEDLPSLVDIFSRCKVITGYPEKKTNTLEYSVKGTDPDLDKEMTEREKKLNEAAIEKSASWYKVYQENEQLKKEAVILCKKKEEFETSPEYIDYLSRKRIEAVEKECSDA